MEGKEALALTRERLAENTHVRESETNREQRLRMTFFSAKQAAAERGVS